MSTDKIIYKIKDGKELKHGWLVRQDRFIRREYPNTLLDSKVLEYLDAIDNFGVHSREYNQSHPDGKQLREVYSRLKTDVEADIRLRDKALLSMCQIFFKRANENLSLKLRDVQTMDSMVRDAIVPQLQVTFTVQKKSHKHKVCPACGEKKNRQKAKKCSECGEDITSIVPTEEKVPPKIFTKNKDLSNVFCKHVVVWRNRLKGLGAKDDDYFFPQVKCIPEEHFVFRKKLGVLRLDCILQSIDPSMTSSFFRYGGAEKYFRLGYDKEQVKELGDWENSTMPEIYAKRKGLTKAQQDFSHDNRIM